MSTNNQPKKPTKRGTARLAAVPSQDRENPAHATPRQMTRKDGSTTSSWGQASGSRPPFAAGNKLAVRHGAYSRELVAAKATEVLAELQEHAPYLDSLLDQMPMEQLLDAEAKRRMISEYIDVKVAEAGIEAVKPNVLTEYTRLTAVAQKAASDLGLTPTSRAKLLKDTGWARRLADEGVHQVAQRGREYRAGRDGGGSA